MVRQLSQAHFVRLSVITVTSNPNARGWQDSCRKPILLEQQVVRSFFWVFLPLQKLPQATQFDQHGTTVHDCFEHMYLLPIHQRREAVRQPIRIHLHPMRGLASMLARAIDRWIESASLPKFLRANSAWVRSSMSLDLTKN